MKNRLLAFSILLGSISASAQSYHFSQFFATPLLTNPAHTGLIDGRYRVSSNFRSQGSGGGNYTTGYASADFSLMRERLPLGHKAGAGIYLMSDGAMTGVVKTNGVGISGAYTVGLDEYGEKSIGAGFQATFQQRRIDYSKLTFENQFGSNGYDGSLPVGEPLDVNSKQFFDVNAGVLYNTVMEDKAFFAGASVYNILQRRENFLSEEFRLPIRLTLQAGGQVPAADNGRAYFSLTTQYQASASETTLGAAYGIGIGEEPGGQNRVLGGLWYRIGDAVIPYLGLQYSGVQAGLSYDYTLSSLKNAPQARNAFELTLIFRSQEQHELRTITPWY